MPSSPPSNRSIAKLNEYADTPAIIKATTFFIERPSRDCKIRSSLN